MAWTQLPFFFMSLGNNLKDLSLSIHSTPGKREVFLLQIP